ncbi:MAG TPA: enolase C-terminal domain-like protein [Candidatus Nitrosopolaris sp.]|nr:enolase C-terminal domain-like protein [Candidatus Nitrosopolaris sp.]
MPIITGVEGRLVFDSRGAKTIEIEIIADEKFIGRACAPSGASVGKHEAQSFPRDSPEAGLKVFETNGTRFIGLEAQNVKAIFDVIRSIDATERYSMVGGGVAYAVSLASVDSASKALGTPLFKLLKPNSPYRFPFPLGNVLGGGKHAGRSTPDIQEILVCPIGARTIMEALEMNFRVHKEVRNVIEAADKDFTNGRGDEGAWAPRATNDEALEIVEKAVKNSGFSLGKEVSMGIDFASSSYWDPQASVYNYSRQGLIRNRDKQIDYVNQLIETFRLIYVEDPLEEEDFEGTASITKKNIRCIVTGDDMLATNTLRAQRAAQSNACSGAILKINQAGSLYEALNFANECTSNNISLITSHRSGESIDSHISHIGIATDSKMIKTGVMGGERVSKLNELLRMSEYGLIDGMAELSHK